MQTESGNQGNELASNAFKSELKPKKKKKKDLVSEQQSAQGLLSVNLKGTVADSSKMGESSNVVDEKNEEMWLNEAFL